MSMPLIQSRDNATVKRLARLLDSARERSDTGLVPIEGCHLIRACVESPGFGTAAITQVLVSEAAMRHPDIAATLPILPAERVQMVARTVFGRLGEEEGTNGIVAVISKPPTVAAPSNAGLRLCLDGIQDPGNVGTLIRTAAAAGAASVLLGRGCADPWSPKSLRAGMGGQFRVAIEADVELASWLAQTRGRVIGADANADHSAFEIGLLGDVAIVLGSEGQGLSDAVRREIRERVSIPMAPGIESLNVAAAGAILCFERVRQARGVAK